MYVVIYLSLHSSLGDRIRACRNAVAEESRKSSRTLHRTTTKMV